LALELSPAVIHLIDVATGQTLAKLDDPRSDRARWLGFTPDGAQLVAIATFSRAIHVWDLRAIRRHLTAMDLDWKGRPFPPAPEADARRSLTVEPLLVEMAPTEHDADDKARRDIETYRRAVESHPDSADACNSLAWVYATAPEHLRDPIQALALAERATELGSGHPMIRNTLGVAYYRAGRYREAADTLRANLPGQWERFLASDLYFLAMSHHQLGELALAQAYYTWAERAVRSRGELADEGFPELAAFRAEAALLMGK
jgi:tetratricopeptide (TPR) repeat protein